MAGMIVTWLQNTEKFSSPSPAARSTVIAVDGAVVSKPMAMNTTRLSGFCAGDLQRVQRRVHHPDVGRRPPWRRRTSRWLPGTRIMSPNEVMITSGCEARWIASSTRPIGMTHTGQPGAVHERDRLGQVVLEPVLVDGVRVAAAHLHELVLAARLAQLGDPGGQGVRLVGVAELIDEPHGVSSYSIRDSARAASSSA